MTRYIFPAIAALALCSAPAFAQTGPALATVVAACGTPPNTYTAGQQRPMTQNTSGQECSAATVTPSGTQDVNLTGINGTAPVTGSGTATGALRVELPTNGTGVIATVGTVTNPVGVKGADGSAISSAANPVNVVQSPTTVQGLTPGQLGSAATNLVLKASAGNLVNASVTIGALSGYLMLFNATSLPGDGAVTPVFCLPIVSNGTNGGASIAWPLPGKFFSTGITAGFSTTGCFTLTASSAAFISGDVK